MKRERKSGPENGPPFVEYRAGLQIAAAAGLMPAPPVPYGPGVQGKSNLSMGAVSEGSIYAFQKRVQGMQRRFKLRHGDQVFF